MHYKILQSLTSCYFIGSVQDTNASEGEAMDVAEK
jgi:hypothetical protein